MYNEFLGPTVIDITAWISLSLVWILLGIGLFLLFKGSKQSTKR